MFIPWFRRYPFEATEKWGDAYRAHIFKTQKAIRKGLPDDETYQKKIGEPTIANIDKMLKPDFVSRKGLSKSAILAIVKAKFMAKGASQKHLQDLKKGYRKFDQGELNSAMVGYHRGQCFGEYRFRNAIDIALGCLVPIILPDKEGGFRLKLGRQLMTSGMLIYHLQYGPRYVKVENDKLSQLLNEYIEDDLVPFETGGPSHCDFIPIPESVTLADSTKVKEIKYEIYSTIISEKNANELRSRWRVIDESTPPNPDEYIGHPEKPAYFDMYLDIQVSKKG